MGVKTLFLFPTEAEAASFRALRSDATVAIIGVGMAQAAACAAAEILAHKPKRVVLCGIAGACDKRVSVGAVVEVVRDSVEGMPEAYAIEYEYKPVTALQQVRTLTVNRSGDAMRNEHVVHGDMPVVEQMEGAGVAAMVSKLGCDNFIHIRAISNRVGEPFELWRVSDAVAALGTAVAQLFKD